MATSLYSGAPGLSLGNSLYKNRQGLFSSASGLITGYLPTPSLALSFSTSQYSLAGQNYTSPSSIAGYSFTRSSGGYAENVDGSLTWFAGTRTNKSFPSTNWPYSGGSVTQTNNYAIAPDGTTSATRFQWTGSFFSYPNSFLSVAATPYTASVYIKSNTSTASQINLILGAADASTTAWVVFNTLTLSLTNNINNGGGGNVITGVTSSVTAVSNGWYRLSITATSSLALSNMSSGLVASIAGTGDINAWGLQVEAATDTRLTYPTAYIPTTTAAVSVDTPRITNKGYLSEEARTNAVYQSQISTTSPWATSLCGYSANTNIAPDGTTTAGTLTATAAYGAILQPSVPVSSSVTSFAYSVYAKANSFNQCEIIAAASAAYVQYCAVLFNLSNGTFISQRSSSNGYTVTSYSIISAGNGWYRLSMNFTAPSASTMLINNAVGANGVNGSSINLWGAQLEAGAFATSYIPTTTAAATRAADVMNYGGTWYNSTAGTIVSNTESGISSGTNRLLYSVYLASAPTGGIGAAALSNVLFLDKFGTGTILVQSSSFTGAGKYAIRYNSSGISGSLSGGSIVSTSTTFPATADNLGVGKSVTSNFLNGYVKSITIYPTALTDQQLQAITA